MEEILSPLTEGIVGRLRLSGAAKPVMQVPLPRDRETMSTAMNLRGFERVYL